MPPRLIRSKRLLWGIVLVVSAGPYLLEAALDHFLWHLVYGGAVGVAIGAGFSLYRGQPPRHASLWALGGYLYMIVPDLLWALPLLWGGEEYPHQPWMDIFLGHVFLDTWSYTTVLLIPTILAAVLLWLTAQQRLGSVPTLR